MHSAHGCYTVWRSERMAFNLKKGKSACTVLQEFLELQVYYIKMHTLFSGLAAGADDVEASM